MSRSDPSEPGVTSAPIGAEILTSSDIRPEPTDEEAAAIVAAIEAVWPPPVVAAPDEEPPRWRFAGRWWSKPIPARRDRPW
ncbi:MAG: hypothetical protein ACRD0G_01575 [Acidimicrobiales bacterium]